MDLNVEQLISCLRVKLYLDGLGIFVHGTYHILRPKEALIFIDEVIKLNCDIGVRAFEFWEMSKDGDYYEIPGYYGFYDLEKNENFVEYTYRESKNLINSIIRDSETERLYINFERNKGRQKRLDNINHAIRGKVNVHNKDLVFRSIKLDDIPQIYTVALESWQFAYRNIFDEQFISSFVKKNYGDEAITNALRLVRSGSMFFHVAEYESKVIGFCNIGFTEKGAELYRIYLLPEYIGKGIGSKLLKQGEYYLLKPRFKRYYCYVHEKNDIGKQFYQNSGFRHVPEKDRENEWYMEKSLITHNM